MNPALVAALIELGVKLEPAVAELLAAGIEAIVRWLDSTNAPPDTVGVVAEIVSGLAASHPDWSGEQKRAYALDATRQYIENCGGVADDNAVNALIELAVARINSRLAAPAA